MKGHKMSSTLYLTIAVLLTLIVSVALVRHLDTRQRLTGKAYDTYDIVVQIVAMFAPFITLITLCVIMS
jgi:ABC-type amino acid transport system permease subunit